jgi:DNA-binding CsgD family transcriptional regulator
MNAGARMQIDLARDNVTLLGRSMLASVAGLSAAKVLPAVHTPRDKSIIGMKEKGHTPDAIASFLGMLTIDLISRLYRLDLHIPHNGSISRKVRKNNARNAWQLAEIRQLIELREQNVSSTLIADRLGRSVGSVRYKTRWLGLPKSPHGKRATHLPLFPNLDTACKARRKPRVRLAWREDHLRMVIDRWLAYQRHEGIARDLGLTPAQVRSKTKILGLPSDRERGLLAMDYRPDTRHATELRGRYLIRNCTETGQVFATQRNGSQRTCPAYQASREHRHVSAFLGAYEATLHAC